MRHRPEHAPHLSANALTVLRRRYLAKNAAGKPVETASANTFADGIETRVPIVKLPRKRSRFPYRTVTLDKTRKKGI
mgnify:CR=1 FL=1